MTNTVVSTSAEELDRLLASGALERIGMGSRRACYRLPGGRHCLKCYRSDEEIAEGKRPGAIPAKPLSETVVREIRRCRFDERGNTSCQEYRYWLELKNRLPPYLMAAFPSEVEQVFLPSRGWALVEELVFNADGSAPRRFVEEWQNSCGEKKQSLFAAFDALATDLERSTIRFYDPQNVLLQNLADGSFRLRITDFEPASRLFVPIDAIPAVARLKVRRRFARYRRNWGVSSQVGCEAGGPQCRVGHAVGENAAGESRVNVLCLKWGDYYGPEYVNRLYAGVKRNLKRPFRFVCVTDDSAGLCPEIDVEPLPQDPHVIGRPWPNIFAKLLIFRDGFAKLSGPTLFLDVDVLVTGPLDRFFDYCPGDFCIIHNWVERRKTLFRKMPDIGNSSCFRFDAGRSNGVYETFLAMKDEPSESWRFTSGSQKFQTFAMMKAGRVHWWPKSWVCSFKRQCIPFFPLNKILSPWHPPKSASIVAFHGQPDIPQALEGYYFKYDRPVRPHLTCKPAEWIPEYWHEQCECQTHSAGNQ